MMKKYLFFFSFLISSYFSVGQIDGVFDYHYTGNTVAYDNGNTIYWELRSCGVESLLILFSEYDEYTIERYGQVIFTTGNVNNFEIESTNLWSGQGVQLRGLNQGFICDIVLDTISVEMTEIKFNTSFFSVVEDTLIICSDFNESNILSANLFFHKDIRVHVMRVCMMNVLYFTLMISLNQQGFFQS